MLIDPLFEDHVLTWVTFLPLGTGLVLLASGMIASFFFGSPGLPASAWRLVGFGSAIITFALSLVGLWGGFDPELSGFQLTERTPWIQSLGVNYFVGIDGISLSLVLLTTFLMPVVLLACWKHTTRSLRSHTFLMLSLETGMIGTFVSLNLFQFYLFWELTLIPMYFIIGIWGGRQRIHAAIKLFLFTMLGSLLMLVAILVLVGLNFEQSTALLGDAASLQFDLVRAPGVEGLSLFETRVPVADAPWWKTQFWLFGAFALAFGIKVPLVPLHTWLPHAHVEAPTAGSVILAGVLLKLGAYAFVRFALPMFPIAATGDFYVPLFFALSLVGIVYGSLLAMVQTDIKKLVAYSSIAHMGFVMLGVFALNTAAITGSVLQMVNHGLSTGALFLLVGFIYERRHTREISAFGGLARVMPVYAAIFGLMLMSSIGLPGLNGFVGEFLILLGTFASNPWVGSAATSALVLAAAYMLWMYRRLMFGAIEQDENRGLLDLDLRERVVMLALALPILWIGLYPNPLLRRIEPSVIEVLEQMQRGGAKIRVDEVWNGSLVPYVAPAPEAEIGEDAPPAEGDAGESS